MTGNVQGFLGAVGTMVCWGLVALFFYSDPPPPSSLPAAIVIPVATVLVSLVIGGVVSSVVGLTGVDEQHT